MRFRVETEGGLVLAEDLDERAPCVRVDEGRIAEKGARFPLDLLPGQSTRIIYPLVGRRLVCRVTRTDGVAELVRVATGRRPRSLAGAAANDV